MNPLVFLRAIRNRVMLRYAVRENVTYGRNLHVGPGSVLRAPRGLKIGNDVYIGKYCTIECDGEIGSGVLIANAVGLIGRFDHDMHAIGVMIRHAPWIGDAAYRGKGKDLFLKIEDDVWIGYGAVVMTGVTIGRGAVVAAGSVVTKSVPSFAVVAGNPARVLGARFTEKEICEHTGILNAKKGS